MRSVTRAGAVGLPVLLSAVLFSGGLLLADGSYLLEQGAYAAHYTFSARPVEEVLHGGNTDEETQALLRRVAEVRRFAVEELDLTETDSYTTYVEMPRDYLVDVVSAVGELSFERFEWQYPILGRLPYKGFYERADAVREARRLEEAGYDVLVRNVDAYSSLGVVPDPLYSYMKSYSEFRLAELIIHELAHATVFVPGAGEFNEGFASVVGREGALAYLRSRYGAASTRYLERTRRLVDRRVFLGFITLVRNRLERVYAEEVPPRQKRARKAAVIEQSLAAFERNRERWFETDAYSWFAEVDLDNAIIDLYATYNAGVGRGYGDTSSVFDAAYRNVGRSIPALVAVAREAAREAGPLEGVLPAAARAAGRRAGRRGQ